MYANLDLTRIGLGRGQIAEFKDLRPAVFVDVDRLQGIVPVRRGWRGTPIGALTAKVLT